MRPRASLLVVCLLVTWALPQGMTAPAAPQPEGACRLPGEAAEFRAGGGHIEVYERKSRCFVRAFFPGPIPRARHLELLSRVPPVTSLYTNHSLLWSKPDSYFERQGAALLARLQSLEVLDLSFFDTDDRWMRYVGRLQLLEGLVIKGRGLTDAGMSPLSSLSKLEHLQVHEARLTPRGMDYLARPPALARLVLGKCELSADALVPLRQARSLVFLYLEGSSVDDRHLLACGQIGALWALSLRSTRVTGKGFEALAQLPDLGYLDLSGTPITDRSLVLLARCRSVSKLRLSGCEEVTDRGLLALSAMRGLESVSVNETRVTADGVKRFRALCPQVEVYEGAK